VLPGVFAASNSWDPNEVKIVLIYKLAQFIRWNTETSPETLNVCVDDSSDIYPLVETNLKDKVVNKRGVQVLAKHIDDDIDGCHILYLSNDSEVIGLRIKQVEQLPILTISSASEFISLGGMIRLYVKNRRIFFEINQEPALSANISISSQLMKLSRKQ